MVAQEPTAPAAPTIEQVVAQLRAREQAAKTVVLRMTSKTVVPDGPVFETEGTLRVLGTTHFHLQMQMRAGEGMEGAHEVVRTPAATWTRESDPMNGEVFTHMSKETMAELEAASKVLGGDAPAGAIPGQAEAPLGSAMVASLAKRFDLKLSGKLVRDGFDHWIIRGDARAGEKAGGGDDAGGQDLSGLPQPDRVEVLVRASSEGPLAVVRMTQFAAAQEVLVVAIEDVQLDVPLTEASFKLDPRGKRVLDVMDHPPAAAQIKAILEQAKHKREAAAEDKDANAPPTDAGK